MDLLTRSTRDRIVIAVLILGVACFALTPALYLMFRALQWEAALRVIEVIFYPSLLLFGMAALLVYRRSQARQAQARWESDESPPPSPPLNSD